MTRVPPTARYPSNDPPAPPPEPAIPPPRTFDPPSLTRRGRLPAVTTAFGGSFTP